jgi:hypothetical protein
MISLTLVALGSYSKNAQAQSNWVTVNSLTDLTDNVVVQSGQPLISGHAYNATMTISVPFTQTQSTFEVSLHPLMKQHGTQFWYRLSEYGGYDPNKFTAGLLSISFNQVEGDLVLSASFSVPQDFTTAPAGLTLHMIKNDVEIVTVKVTGGATVGTYTQDISDEAIQRYLDAYALKSAYISQGKIDPAYSDLVDGILARSHEIYVMGLPDSALSVLDSVDQKYFPAPPNNSMTLILVVVAAIIGVIAVVAVLMLLRTKTRLSNAENTANDIQKELAALEVSATQFDKVLAEKISALKNKIGEILE